MARIPGLEAGNCGTGGGKVGDAFAEVAKFFRKNFTAPRSKTEGRITTGRIPPPDYVQMR